MCAVFARILHSVMRYTKMDATEIPVVVVLGSTGAGKSKLAIEIAEEFNGEIISADSMQVYKGLDIISNKVTPEEQEQVPHHMIDVVEPTISYSVVKFRDACLSIIEDLHGRRKLPVIVGGTNYYIESVLWKVLVADRGPDGDAESQPTSRATESPTSSPVSSPLSSVEDSADAAPGSERGNRQRLELLSTEELYAQLRALDPGQAQVLHPNERRKILRSLEVTLRSGRPMSEHLRLQRAEAGGGVLGGPLRFPRACLLWVTAEQDTLDRRLDARVDTMLQRGLLEELADFHRRYNAARLRDGVPADYTRGIFQSIGFKEFHGYLTRPETTDADKAAKLLADGVDRLKLVTRRYARKQSRWVRRRFLSAGSRQVPPLYRLNSTDPGQWEELVRRPAIGVVRAWLDGKTPKLEPEHVVSTNTGDRTTYHCAVCDVYTSGAQQRDAHLNSRRHHRALQGRKRRQEREDFTGAKRAAVEAEVGGEVEGVREEQGSAEGDASGEVQVTAEQEEERVTKTTLSKREAEVKDGVHGAG